MRLGLIMGGGGIVGIPGYFPTVGFDGRRYMDGPRGKGMTHRLLRETECDRALFVGPNAAMSQPSALLEAEFDQIRQSGIDLQTITGGDALRAIGMNLMDPTLRSDGVRAGLDDGRHAARTLKDLQT